MLLKTIIAVNQLSSYGAVAKWCNSKGTEDSVDLNENCDISPRRMTKLTQHVTPDLFDQARRNLLQPIDKRTPPGERKTQDHTLSW